MFRFEQRREIVEALIDDVREILGPAGTTGQYDGHDVINGMNARFNGLLNEAYDLYPGADPEMTANQQIGKFLENRLGQVKVGERNSARTITRSEGRPPRNGTCRVSVWEISDRTREALEAAREPLLGL